METQRRRVEGLGYPVNNVIAKFYIYNNCDFIFNCKFNTFNKIHKIWFY